MKIALIVIAVLVALIVCVYAYYGGFKKISFNIERQGGETFVYEDMLGAYKQAPKVQDRIYYALLNEEKIETTKGIGVYYDNPQKTEESKMRSEIGCILNVADSATLEKLAGKYQVKTLPESDFIVSEFPYKGALSVIVGLMKFYPALARYCAENGYEHSPVTEIYDIANGKIIYRKEIVK